MMALHPNNISILSNQILTQTLVRYRVITSHWVNLKKNNDRNEISPLKKKYISNMAADGHLALCKLPKVKL